MKTPTTRRPARQGTLKGGLPYLTVGQGPPLVVFKGLSPQSEMRLLTPLTRQFTVYLVDRPRGLLPSTTMADLAAEHALALEDEFGGEAIDVVGISTGGSVALQMAADHPQLLHKLVLACSAYRLSPSGRELQRRYGDLLALGHPRQAARALAPGLTGFPLGRAIAGGLLWVLAPLTNPQDPSDMITTIRAEDAFDLGNRLGEITMPTLIIGGDRDFYYEPELFRQTADGIPNARLSLYRGRTHVTAMLDQRFTRDIMSFLLETVAFSR